MTTNAVQHPVAAFFFLFFKAAALLLYIFCTLFFSSFVIVFVVSIILLAFDFWTVQKVSGRLLVGLRWWSHQKEDGSTEWHFESVPDRSKIHASDSRFFWGVLVGTPVVFGLLVFVGLLKLNFGWILIPIAGIVFSSVNLIGYYKCIKDARQKITAFVGRTVLTAATSAAVSSLSNPSPPAAPPTAAPSLV